MMLRNVRSGLTGLTGLMIAGTGLSAVFTFSFFTWTRTAEATGRAAASTASNSAEAGVGTSADVQMAAGDSESDVEEIVIVGSRRQVRSETSTLVPVDIVHSDDISAQGSFDMGDMLRTFVPAYNINHQPISDAATLIRPANLRGLPPDMTVVLVNGKRRHRGAVIAFLGGGVSSGAQGVDISVIPSVALKRVEVLRDGAAAQYGADAIAGVMNFVLKDDREGVSFQAQYGSTYRGDGDALRIAGNWGLPLTAKGFLNLSAEFSTTDPTSRSVQRADAQQLVTEGNLAVRRPAQIWGSPEVTNNVKLFANAGLDVSDSAHAYAFGNYARRTVLGGFYFRNPNTRSNVFSNDGGQTRLVGDLTPNDAKPCPSVSVGDAQALQNVSNDPNCFVFNEMFPGGFTPQFGGDVEDMSLVAGVRGELDSGMRWDLSAGVGQSFADFLIKNTVNASLGPASPTQFNPGAYRQVDQNVNLDLAYPMRVGLFASPLNVAGGLELREERFVIREGDRQSFEIGPLFDQGFSIGSNGFPGFSTDQAGTFTRRNVATYVDLETDILVNWAMGLAGRVEHFDTFGTAATAKAATRVTLLEDIAFVDTLALRGTGGTGFRAPTPGQANVNNVTTVGNPDGTLVNRGTIAPTNPIAASKGGRELEPEKSVNVGGGIALTGFDGFSITADYYVIRVRDRIAQSGTYQLTDSEALALEHSGVRGASDLEEFRFYTNGIHTTTRGLDVVATYKMDWSRFGQTRFGLAYNWNRTRVDNPNSDILDQQRIRELQHYLPKHRGILSASHTFGPLRVLARGHYFGSFSHPETNPEGPLYMYGPRVLTDFELAYTLQDTLTLTMGAQNAFNVFPEKHVNPGSVGNRYPENAPAGLSGGFWYTRLSAHL